MNVELNGLVIICGNYGSGKTEVAVNLAAYRKQLGGTVRIADLDLVNPYFRTREVRNQLHELGVEVVLPAEMYIHADLPILSRSVSGMIRGSADLTILDVGGDEAGATVLSSLANSFQGKTPRMLQVINPFRPQTGSIEGVLKIKSEIERASRLTINGFIGNANLIDETTPELIYEGYEFLSHISNETQIPLEFVTVPADLKDGISIGQLNVPILYIQRQLVPPWKLTGRPRTFLPVLP
ncbi:MAG: cobalamin biosynthesis protein CbiA [Desulfatirhabdiaceae bacterium]